MSGAKRQRPSAVPLLEAGAVVVAQPRVQRQQPAVRAVEVPWPAVGEMVAEGDRVELLGDPDVVEAAVVAVAQREVDEPMRAGERHRRLGALTREQLQAASGAAGEDQDEGTDAGHVASSPGPSAGSSSR